MTEGKAEGQAAEEPAGGVTPAEATSEESAQAETAPAETAPAETVPAETTAAEETVPAAVTPAEPATRPGNLGIWAFVLALLGLVGLLPIIGSVLGFVLGRVAVRQSDSHRVRGGRGLAIAAVTISVITLAIIVLSVAAYALIVAYLEI